MTLAKMNNQPPATTSIRSSRALPLLGLMLSMLFCAAFARAQTLTGRWAATGKTLDNGEQQKAILALKQDGSQLTGTVRGLGYMLDTDTAK